MYVMPILSHYPKVTLDEKREPRKMRKLTGKLGAMSTRSM
jgi:hypothetical protein